MQGSMQRSMAGAEYAPSAASPSHRHIAPQALDGGVETPAAPAAVCTPVEEDLLAFLDAQASPTEPTLRIVGDVMPDV